MPRAYTRITTGQLNEIRRRNADGENDAAIADAMGLKPELVNKYRNEMGLPVRRMKRPYKKQHTYTVYNAKTDQLLAFGTVDQCVAMLGYSNYTHFYSIVSKVAKGVLKKYEILVEEVGEA